MLDEKKIEVRPTGKMERGIIAPVTPFSFMRRFTEEMEKMFNDFDTIRFPKMFGRDLMPLRMEMKELDWVPPIEIKQKDGTLMIHCELPGMKKEDIDVRFEAEKLMISGERKEEKEEKREGFYRSERSYGKFYRQFVLPPGVKAETANATFQNGMLEITMKVEKGEPKVRSLEIKEPNKVAKAATA